MADVRLCKDCRHYIKAGYVGQCMNPKNMRADLENGGSRPFAAILWLRGDADKCGESGAWFELRAQPEAASGACEVVT